MAGRPKGLPKTGGRKAGTPNRMTREVREAILRAFEKVGGEDYLVRVARNDPKTFCTLLGKLVPAEVRAAVEPDRPVVAIRGAGAGRLRSYRYRVRSHICGNRDWGSIAFVRDGVAGEHRNAYAP